MVIFGNVRKRTNINKLFVDKVFDVLWIDFSWLNYYKFNQNKLSAPPPFPKNSLSSVLIVAASN